MSKLLLAKPDVHRMLNSMLKEDAAAKKLPFNEDRGIELSSSPFEQKFAELRPTEFRLTPSPSPQNTVIPCLLAATTHVWMFY
jgi:hypothetical protein